ncbi:MAG: rane fusion protein hemolysin [Chthoniobacter sp.]|jgi:HlyD family secretion protein|nr:rane fusion protein hemolysin [Chthoniobacter sp.]
MVLTERLADVSIFTFQKNILDAALPFQGDLTHLLEEPLPKGIRSTIYYCVFLAVVSMAVSILFKVDVVVQGTGKLTYDGPPIVLQAFERTVLRSLLVKPGDTVHKGQILATLDPTFAQADLTALDERRKLVHAQVKRIEGEAYGTGYQPESSDGQAGLLQSELFLQRANEYQSRIKAFSETIEESEAGLLRIGAEREILKQQLAIATSVEGIQENLWKSKTNSQLEFLGARSSRLISERDFQDSVDRLVEKQHQLNTAQAQKESFVQEWRRTLLEDLTKQRSEESQLDAALTKSSRINSLVVISAPADGIVLDIANRSVGSVLRETEPLIILAPTDAPLLCEMELGSSEIGEVAVGDPVLIKIDAFPYQRYGGLSGRIRSISHESHVSGGNALDLEAVANKRAVHGGSHRVAVELESCRMEHLPPNRTLFPGMTSTGEVHIGKRRLINYLLDPLLRGLRESFREA